MKRLLATTLFLAGLAGCESGSTPNTTTNANRPDASSASSDDDGTSEQPGTDSGEATADGGNAGTTECSPDEYECDGAALRKCVDGKFRTEETCASAALCEAPECKPPECEEGVVRCDGVELEECNSDRTGWASLETCESAAQCSAKERACTPEPCTAGSLQCNDTELQRCQDDDAGWETVQSCATSGLCDAEAGACLTPACAADETRCEGANFQRCNDARDDFATVQLCANAELCEGDNGCVTPACLPGEHRCTGSGVLEVCAGQAGWTAIAQCSPAVLCNPVEQQCDAEPCAADAERCNGAVFEKCEIEGDQSSWVPKESCVNSALCGEGGCKAPTCVPDEHRCNGARLQVCNARLNGWLEVQQCSSASQCRAAEKRCVRPVCDPGVCVCQNDALFTCNDNRTGFVKIEECNSAAECDARACQCADACQPGVVRCNGRVLEACLNKLVGWERVATCATRQLCNENQQKCDTPICNNDDFDCQGKTLRECAGGRHRFNPIETCAEICDADNGQCDLCVPDEFSCMADNLQRCSADGQDQVPQQECPSGLCQADGAGGECLQCQPAGNIRCNDEGALLECSPDQKREDQIDACGSSSLCDDENDRCLVCEPAGALRCDGKQLFQCNDTQTAEDLVRNCVSAAACDQAVTDGSLSCPEGECETGEFACSGQDLLECVDAKLVLRETCDAAEECDETVQGCVCSGSGLSCVAGELLRCDQGTFKPEPACIGATAVRFCEDGQPEQKSCDTGTTCSEDAKDCVCEEPLRCVNGVLEQCEGNGNFSPAAACEGNTLRTCAPGPTEQVCEGGTTCDADTKSCQCPEEPWRCVAGELQKCEGGSFAAAVNACEGSTLRTCDAQGDTLQTQDCSATSCDEGKDECVPAMMPDAG